MIRALIIDTQDLLGDIGRELVSDLKGSTPVATGKLKNSYVHNVSIDGPVVSLTISADEHFKFVENGRRPGKFPPLVAISRWCEAKGIPVRAAFPIAKKIAEKGIEPKHILSGVISSRQDGISSRIRSMFAERVRIEAKNLVTDFTRKR